MVGGYEKAKGFESGFLQNANDPFLVGKLAMKTDGDWIIKDIAQYNPTLDFGVAPAPVPDDRYYRRGIFNDEREPFITWRKKGFVRVLYQTGSKRDPRLKDVPLFNELMDKYKTADNVRRLAKVILAADEFGRPIVLPPGVPADRVKIIRDAFNKAINDPALLAEAEKRRLDIDPATGEELESLAKEVMTAPPDVVEKVKKILGM